MVRRFPERRELAVLALDALPPKRELVARRLPFEVRKERVVAHGAGSAFGEAEDDHEIEVSPMPMVIGPTRTPSPNRPTPEVGFELERKRA